MEIMVGKTAGFCYGIKRAIEGSQNLMNDNLKKIYCLGEMAHNKQVMLELEKKGIQFIETIDEISKEVVIFRPHGIPKNIYEQARNQGIEIIDYTCPHVLKVHEIAEEFEKLGYYIFLTGKQNHPEVIGTISHCGNQYSLITSKEDIDQAIKTLAKSGMKKLLIISQTTFNLKKFEDIVKMIAVKTSEDIDITVKNTICNATQVRQKETEDLSKKVDIMIIIGGKNSDNTKKLYEIAKANCDKAIWIETKEEIEKSLFENMKNMKIGIMAGASTPQKSIDEVIQKLYANE